MNPSKIDIDRNISKLRVNSSEFLNLDKANLVTMLDQTIDNIKTISYYWATLASEKKGILNKSKEGEEWIGCLLYTSPSPRDRPLSRMPSSA